MKAKMQSIVRLGIISFGSICLLTCCKCGDDPAIDSFSFQELNPPVSGTINSSTKTVQVTVPESTDVTALVPTIEVDPECYTINPASGVAQDFTSTVIYEVKNEKGDASQFRVEVSVGGGGPQSLQINWEEKAPLPSKTGWMPAVELDGKVYVIGGIIEDLTCTNLIYVYDPSTDTWDGTKAGMNIPRNGHTATVVGGKIYVMGGIPTPIGPAVNSVEVYDPQEDTWEFCESIPHKVDAHAAAAVDGKIYLIGGEPSEPPEHVTYDNVYAYDPSTDSWTSCEPMPEPRAWLAASAVNGKIYTFGGVHNDQYVFHGSIFMYDPVADAWEDLGSTKSERMAPATCVINDHIFMLAGAPTVLSGGFSTVEVYNPADNSLMSGTKASSPRLAAAACSYQGKIYLIGGAVVGAPWDVYTDLMEVGEVVWE